MEKLVACAVLKGKIKAVTSICLNNKHEEIIITSQMLRNKMMNLLSINYGLERENIWKRHTCQDKSCFLCLIFGANNERRLTIRDSLPVKKEEAFPREFKVEGNHFTRKIPPDTEFDMEMMYKIFDFNQDKGKRDSENFKYIMEAFTLIEEDYIGKGGSRGSGKIIFSHMSIKIFNTENLELSLPCEYTWQEDKDIKKIIRI